MKKYKNISHQVKINSLSYTILRLDNSMDIEDLTQDVYLKLHNKYNEKYYHRQVKMALIDIYRKMSHKTQICSLEEDIIYEDTSEIDVIIQEGIDMLEQTYPQLKNFIYDYFFKNLTYRELAKKYNVSFVTAKNKVDKGVNILKNYYNE